MARLCPTERTEEAVNGRPLVPVQWVPAETPDLGEVKRETSLSVKVLNCETTGL